MVASAEGLRVRLLDRVQGAGDTGTSRTIDKMHARTSRRTGALDASIGCRQDFAGPDLFGWTVEATEEHASYQDDGTGIYGPTGQPIRPVNARFLVFDWPAAGGVVFARQVRGSPPTHFYSLARDEWLDEIRAAWAAGG